jgi:hypothetical protein
MYILSESIFHGAGYSVLPKNRLDGHSDTSNWWPLKLRRGSVHLEASLRFLVECSPNDMVAQYSVNRFDIN